MKPSAFHSPTHRNNQEFVAFARRKMGGGVRIDNFSRDFGRPSIVWRLTTSDGTRAWLKHHEGSTLYHRELLGLERFVPALAACAWWSAPMLLDRDDDLEVILMSEVEGELLNTSPASAGERAAMFRLAGRFARALHGLDSPAPDGIGDAAYFRDRLEYYLDLGKDFVEPSTFDWARAQIERACAAGGIRRVPCHMDFSPRNWLIRRSEQGLAIGVIDWERARWDLWQQDVQRLAYDHWSRDPRLREAFFTGYGRTPSEIEALQLDTLCLITAITSIPWAIDHRDTAYAELNRKVIERIRAKIGPASA